MSSTQFTVPMRPRRLRRFLALMAFGALIAGMGSGVAKADPAVDYAADHSAAICATLDDYPSVEGVLGIGQAIHEDGLSFYEAGRAIGLAVAVVCPEHQALLDRFIASVESADNSNWFAV